MNNYEKNLINRWIKNVLNVEVHFHAIIVLHAGAQIFQNLTKRVLMKKTVYVKSAF